MKRIYVTPELRIVKLTASDFLSGSSEGDNCVDDPYDDPWGRIFREE